MAIVTCSLNCFAIDYVSIHIDNYSDKMVEIEDQDNNTTSIDPEGTGQLLTRIRRHNAKFLEPDDNALYSTIITVNDGERFNSISVDQNTRTLTIGADFHLERN